MLNHPKFEDLGAVFCSQCGNSASVFKCRLVHKAKGAWRCDVCSVKLTQLNRAFGQWPLASFTRLSQEEQQLFFSSCRDSNGPDTVSKMKEIIKKHQSSETYYVHGGEYVPLDVWAKRGFNVEDIRDRSEACDQQQHPVLGAVYRVRILVTGSRGSEGSSWSQEMIAAPAKRQRTKKSDASCSALVSAAAAVETEKDQNEDAEKDDDVDEVSSSDSDDSDSDSDSSSNDKHKKKGKAKKAKKSKKSKSKRSRRRRSTRKLSTTRRKIMARTRSRSRRRKRLKRTRRKQLLREKRKEKKRQGRP